jgi:hypothetical protein
MKYAEAQENTIHLLWDAEDRAFSFLCNYSAPIARATALAAEKSLALEWGKKQQEMIACNDPREAICITRGHWDELKRRIDAIPPNVLPDEAAVRHVVHIFSEFAPDSAWRVMRKLTTQIHAWSRITPWWFGTKTQSHNQSA